METRFLALTVPSAVVLALLIIHSCRSLPRARAAAFWAGAVLYAVLRSAALGFVTEEGLGATRPFVIRNPLLPLFGVPLQEIIGWAIVAYIAWWLGNRFSERLFAQVAWGSLFLGTISWCVESAAAAAGWWYWTVPVPGGLLGNVPLIGIIDWFFVGLDFLLPFQALTSGNIRAHPARLLSLLLFPVHFTGHLFVGIVSPALPIPIFHLVHWLLLAGLFMLATRSDARDPAFAMERAARWAWLPLTALAIIIADAAAVHLLISPGPRFVVSILPATVLAVHTYSPVGGTALAAASLLAGMWMPSFLPSAIPPAVAALLAWGHRRLRAAAVIPLAILAMGILAWQIHSTEARRGQDLTRRLDGALAARDRGDLAAAIRELEETTRLHPGSHVPQILLGEIFYRTGQLERSRPCFLSAVRIKQSYMEGYRYLAVIELRNGSRASAARFAASGLAIDSADRELRYLHAHASGAPSGAILDQLEQMSPEAAHSLASLAFEVGDHESAAAMLDIGLSRWPLNRSFYQSRVKLALEQGERETARRVAITWRNLLPEDPEAQAVSRHLGIE